VSTLFKIFTNNPYFNFYKLLTRAQDEGGGRGVKAFTNTIKTYRTVV